MQTNVNSQERHLTDHSLGIICKLKVFIQLFVLVSYFITYLINKDILSVFVKHIQYYS